MQKDTIKKVLDYIKKYKILVALSLIFAAVTVALTLYVPILIGRAVDFIIGKGNVDFDSLIKIAVEIVVIVAITAVLQWLMSICNNKITYGVVRDIRNEAFEKIERMPLSYIDTHEHGDIVSRIIADVDTFADGLLMGFTQAFTGIITIFGTLIFMVTINFKITILVVLVTPLSLVIANFIAKRTYKLFRKQSEIKGKQTGIINEMIGNQKVVKAYSKEADVLERFDEINDELQKVSLKAIFYSSTTNPATRFVNAMVYAVVGIVGAIFVINGHISVGGLSSFLSYANQYTKPFNEISSVITELQNALACAARIFDLIYEKSEEPDKEGAIESLSIDGTVSLKNVNFSYVPDKKLIENFSLDVKKGQKIAIVGPTGCGKTTLINLLMRFYDVNSGSISISGENIMDMTRDTLRNSYGMVLQETWLKAGTIKENLMMGNESATVDEVIEAAKASHAHSFIRRLENGYDTYIGEDGGSLSQGQKQLLCIARVMLTKPPMLILDEATSSIDTRTEIKIQEAFNILMKGRTSFIVAHRLSTIREADVILVMKDGNIIEQGNHDELMEKGGFYANLYNSQFAV